MSVDMNKVPMLSRVQVEQAADWFLKDAGNRLGYSISPPIEPDILAEFYLDLRIEYCDLTGHSKIQDTFGALILADKLIKVEETLQEGRLNFTIGHELGHWVLHRKLIKPPNPDQLLMFDDDRSKSKEPSDFIVCRKSNSREWGERQADWFSAALLMPMEFVKRAYYSIFSHPHAFKQETLDGYINGFKRGRKSLQDIFEGLNPRLEILDIIDRVKEAGDFHNVSDDAMRIRLQKLNLIISEEAPKMVFAELLGKDRL